MDFETGRYDRGFYLSFGLQVVKSFPVCVSCPPPGTRSVFELTFDKVRSKMSEVDQVIL